MPYNPQRRSAGINKGKRTPRRACDETWSTRASTTTPPEGALQFNLVMHQMMLCSREVGSRDNKSVGTDFRYAVEFSKYGRTPATTARPSWGQPDRLYRLTSATPNRLGTPAPALVADKTRPRPRSRGDECRV